MPKPGTRLAYQQSGKVVAPMPSSQNSADSKRKRTGLAPHNTKTNLSITLQKKSRTQQKASRNEEEYSPSSSSSSDDDDDDDDAAGMDEEEEDDDDEDDDGEDAEAKGQTWTDTCAELMKR